MIELCRFRKRYTTTDKIGIHCTHPIYYQAMRITCDLVCAECDLDRSVIEESEVNVVVVDDECSSIDELTESGSEDIEPVVTSEEPSEE